jgi:hypothetical protein
MYTIVAGGAYVTSSKYPSYTSIIAELPVGARVQVLEVVRVEGIASIRGRIEDPAGWLSLLEVQYGFQWAEQQEENSVDLSLGATAGADGASDGHGLREAAGDEAAPNAEAMNTGHGSMVAADELVVSANTPWRAAQCPADSVAAPANPEATTNASGACVANGVDMPGNHDTRLGVLGAELQNTLETLDESTILETTSADPAKEAGCFAEATLQVSTVALDADLADVAPSAAGVENEQSRVDPGAEQQMTGAPSPTGATVSDTARTECPKLPGLSQDDTTCLDDVATTDRSRNNNLSRQCIEQILHMDMIQRNAESTASARERAATDSFNEDELQAYEPKANADGGYDAFIIYASGRDALGRDNDKRATALAIGLQAKGLTVRLQAQRSGSAPQGGNPTADDTQLMTQVARCSKHAVVLLTRRFIDRVEAGVLGDGCAAAFALAKRMPNVRVGALESELLVKDNWGWNRVFARLSGQAVVDVSMPTGTTIWDDGVAQMAWFLSPQAPLHLSTQGGLGAERGRRQIEVLSQYREADRRDPTMPWRYHCFLSHAWGKDKQGRDNHRRVSLVAQLLKRNGLDVFFDEWEISKYRNVDEAFVTGMRSSAVAVVFITKDFIDKVSNGDVCESCVAQFNLAKLAPCIIPVVMDKSLVKPEKWGWNEVYTLFCDEPVLDMSSDDGSMLSLPWNSDVQQWYTALDALETLIRAKTAALDRSCGDIENDSHDLPPLVPHRDIMRILAACFASASLMIFGLGVARLDNPERTLLAGEEGIALLSGVLLAAAFFNLGVWHAQRARLPPQFRMDSSILPRAALTASVIGFLGSISLVVRSGLACFFSVALPILDLVAAAGFLGSSLAFCWDSATWRVLSCPLSFGNLPFFAEVAFCFAAICLVVAWNPGHTGEAFSLVLQVLGACALFASSALRTVWAALTPKHIGHFCRPGARSDFAMKNGTPGEAWPDNVRR